MTDNSLNLSQVIRKRLTDADKRYWAGDNISKYITEKEKDLLVDDLLDYSQLRVYINKVAADLGSSFNESNLEYVFNHWAVKKKYESYIPYY